MGDTVKLVDICTPKQWKTIPTSALLDRGYPVYGANGIIGYYNKYNHENSVVAITCRGATCGSVHITVPNAYITGNAMCLDDLREDIEPYYLYYCLLHFDFQSVISGSAQPQITRQGLEKVLIPICSRDRQVSIANRLKKAENIIAKWKEELAKLDTLVKSRFIEMFGDPVTNPMGWDKEPLKKHTDVIVGYPFSSTEYVANGIPIVGGYNLMQGFVQWENSKYLQSAKGYEQYLLKDNDIVIAMDRPWVGNGFKIAVIQETYLPAILIQRTACIRCCDVSSAFLYMLLDNVGFADHCHITGSLVPHISNKDILSYEIIVPPIALQNQFAAFVAQVDKSKSVLQKLLEKQELLRAALMQEYFG